MTTSLSGCGVVRVAKRERVTGPLSSSRILPLGRPFIALLVMNPGSGEDAGLVASCWRMLDVRLTGDFKGLPAAEVLEGVGERGSEGLVGLRLRVGAASKFFRRSLTGGSLRPSLCGWRPGSASLTPSVSKLLLLSMLDRVLLTLLLTDCLRGVPVPSRDLFFFTEFLADLLREMGVLVVSFPSLSSPLTEHRSSNFSRVAATDHVIVGVSSISSFTGVGAQVLPSSFRRSPPPPPEAPLFEILWLSEGALGFTSCSTIST